MNLKPFESKGADDLRSYLEFLLWHYRVVDAFWFIYASERFEQRAAEQLNEKVWQKAGAMAAAELIKRFQLKGRGLDGFLEALRLYPWSLLTDYQVEREGDDLVLTVPCCPSQEARLRRGLSEYACKRMHRGEFESFASVVDPRICVRCVFAPPDQHPKDAFCQWRFSMGKAA